MKAKQAKRYMRTTANASAARPREDTHATLETALGAAAGLGTLIVLFGASLAYVAFGGTLAFDASPLPEAEVASAAALVITADTGGAPRRENLSGNSAEPANHSPANDVNRSRDVSGNVMTYEHD